MACDYKFKYIQVGTNTEVKIRYHSGSGSYSRDSVIGIVTDTFSGAKTYDWLVDYYNGVLPTYGTPIPEQTTTNFLIKEDVDKLLLETGDKILKE